MCMWLLKAPILFPLWLYNKIHLIHFFTFRNSGSFNYIQLFLNVSVAFFTNCSTELNIVL